MSVRRNIAVARKFNEEIVSKKLLDQFATVLHEKYQWYGGTEGRWPAPEAYKGLESTKRAWAAGFEKYKNVRVVIEDIFGQKDRVAIRMTHWVDDKPFQNCIAIYRFADGKIIEDWAGYTPVK